MLELSERDETTEAAQPEPGRRSWLAPLHAASTRRALLLTALGGLLIAGVVTALPTASKGPLGAAVEVAGPARNAAFAEAKPGTCLNWPDNAMESIAIVDCKDDHRFEVAETVDMRAYPGSEFGPDADPPSPARIQQITLEQCQPAVERYLGPKYDPTSRFSTRLVEPIKRKAIGLRSG